MKKLYTIMLDQYTETEIRFLANDWKEALELYLEEMTYFDRYATMTVKHPVTSVLNVVIYFAIMIPKQKYAIIKEGQIVGYYITLAKNNNSIEWVTGEDK